MKHYTIEVTSKALEDMEEIYNYIALVLHAPGNALGQYNRIADAILTLDTLAERFKILKFSEEQEQWLRRIPVDNYSVFFIIKGDSVIVTRVLYSASDIENRLK